MLLVVLVAHNPMYFNIFTCAKVALQTYSHLKSHYALQAFCTMLGFVLFPSHHSRIKNGNVLWHYFSQLNESAIISIILHLQGATLYVIQVGNGELSIILYYKISYYLKTIYSLCILFAIKMPQHCTEA